MKIKYHFFGKECLLEKSLADLSDLKNNLTKLGFNQSQHPVFVNQVHGNEVLLVNQAFLEQSNQIGVPIYQADAIVCNVKKVVIGLFTADCLPLLLVDQEREVIAAVHCGHKGALNNIVANAVNSILEIGSHSQNIQAIFGPCIRQQSYQISQEFYDNFLAKKAANQQFFIPDLNSNGFLFNLPEYIKAELAEYGIKKIIDQQIDTYSNDNFFSYRKSYHLGKVEEKRNVSVIEMLNDVL